MRWTWNGALRKLAAAPAISFHWRIQPVIDVAADGRSANMRTYLFQPRYQQGAGRNP